MKNGTLAMHRGFNDSETPSSFASFATQQAARRLGNGCVPPRRTGGQILAITKEERWDLAHSVKCKLRDLIPARHCFSHDIGKSSANPQYARELRNQIKRMIKMYRRLTK